MANYSLVINSRFRPFEYQELLAPVLMATQAHQALEEAYGNLDTEAAVWDRRTAGSEKAHALYTNFARDLASEAETLSRYGLTPQSRRAMLNMRSRYASDITPIAEAWTKRQADIKAQQEALVKDPTHFFNRIANNISLDEYMDNQSLDVLSDNYSGALLTQQVGQAAANLKQTLMKKGELTKLGLPYQYERMLQYGASADEVFAAMSKDPKALPILTKLVEDVMASSGIRNWSSMNGDWANNDMYQRAEAYAMQGLYNAIGTTKFDHFQDQAGLTQLQYDLQDRNNARQHARTVAEQKRRERVTAQQQQGAGGAGGATRLNPLALRSPQEISTNKKEIDRWIKAGYFKKDARGNYRMTHRGFEEMRRMVTRTKPDGSLYMSGDPMISAYVGPQETYREHTPFYNFMVKLNGGKSFLDNKGHVLSGWGPGRAGNLFGAYVARNQEGSYDTYHSTEYDRQLSSAYGKEVMSQMWSAAGTKGGNRVLIPVEFNGKNGWKEGKALKASDLSGYTVSNIRYSRYGNTAILQKDGENPIRVGLPKGIHLGSESNINTAITNADDYGLILSRGMRPRTNASGTALLRDANGNIQFTSTPLTDADRTLFTQYQRDALDEMGYYGSQLVVPSKTKDEEYSPFNF